MKKDISVLIILYVPYLHTNYKNFCWRKLDTYISWGDGFSKEVGVETNIKTF